MTTLSAPSRDLLGRLQSHRAAIRDVLTRYDADHLRVFGSVARGDARVGSDLDLMVDLRPQAGNELLRVAGISEELSDLLGCRVDVVTSDLLRPEVSATALADAIPA